MRKLIYTTLIPSYKVFHRKDHCLIATLVNDLSFRIKRVSQSNRQNRKVAREKRKKAAKTLAALKPSKKKLSPGLIRPGRYGNKPFGKFLVRANNKKL